MNIANTRREFKELPIGLIDDPILPSRSQMDDRQMDELVESVRAIGLQQPMIVARVGERFEVVAGHRRRIACGRAGLVVAPCIIYPEKSSALEAIKYAENRFREELSAADEALWFNDLLNGECGGDIEKLAALVGEKIPYIDSRLALFRGDPRVFTALQDGRIKIGVAHELNKFPSDDWRNYYLDNAIRGGATISVVQGWYQDWKRTFGDQPAAPIAPAAASVDAPGSTSDPFACLICGRSDHAHAIRFVPIHTHCQLAVLDPLLNQGREHSG